MAGKSDMDRFSVLPLELQERIFNLLPIRDITVGRQLCTTTRQVIDSAIALRYQLELAAAGMVDNPECTSLSFAEKYRLLRRFTEARNTFCQPHYSEMKFEVMPLGPLHLLWNTSILFAVDSMKIMRLPSTILGTAAVESTYSPSQLPPGSRMVCVNPVDDLSVMIRNEEEGLKTVYFLSLTKGCDHPLAAQPAIILSCRSLHFIQNGLQASFHGNVYGKMLGLMLYNYNEASELIAMFYVVNWLTGDVIKKFEGFPGEMFAWLDADHIAVVSRHLPSEIRVLRLTDPDPCLHFWTFTLPFHTSATENIIIRSCPFSAVTSINESNTSPFTTSPHHFIVLLDITTARQGWMMARFHMIFQPSALLKWITSAGTSENRSISFEQWVPNTCHITPRRSTSTPGHPICGTRYIIPDYLLDRAVLMDFHPYSLKLLDHSHHTGTSLGEGTPPFFPLWDEACIPNPARNCIRLPANTPGCLYSKFITGVKIEGGNENELYLGGSSIGIRDLQFHSDYRILVV